jgi:hypothetical protein
LLVKMTIASPPPWDTTLWTSKWKSPCIYSEVVVVLKVITITVLQY